MIPETLRELAVPIDTLRPYSKNPRNGDLEAIKESLTANDQYRPIVVNSRDNTILAGNHTYAAAMELGWAEIAATFVDADEEQAAKIVLVDNRTNDLAWNDSAQIAELLAQMDDLSGTGYTDEGYEELLANIDSAEKQSLTDPDDVPEVPEEPVTKRGDVWFLGKHRLMCGDATVVTDVERLMDGEKANVVFTSPPYASQRRYDEESEFRPIRPGDYGEWFAEVQANIRTILAENGSYFLNIKEHCEDGQRHLYVKDLTISHVREWGWRFVDEFCWRDTKNGVPGGWANRFKDAWEPVFHYCLNPQIKFFPLANGTDSDAVFVYSPSTTKTKTGSGLLGEKATAEKSGKARPSNVVEVAASSQGDHSATFPVALPAWFVRAYSGDGDIVFDPFTGSGTTLIAAHDEDRIGYGLEISPRYCDVIAHRFQQHTGILPVLEATGETHDFTQEKAMV